MATTIKMFSQILQENKQRVLGAAPREFQAWTSESLRKEKDYPLVVNVCIFPVSAHISAK